MDKRISDLNSATSLQGTEVFAVVQNGETKKTSLNSIVYGRTPGNNYGLFNQTGSSTPVVGTDYSGSLIGGGVGTLSVPPNSFQKGDAYHATLFGDVTIANGHTLEVHIESEGVTLVDTGVITMPKITNKNWQMDINFSINEIGNAGTAEITTAGLITFRTDSSNDVVTEIFSSINNTTFDTTILNTLVVNAIFANVDGGDSINSHLFTLRKIY